jgi:hypothetical protein
MKTIACPGLLPNAEHMAEAGSNLCKPSFQATQRFVVTETMRNGHNERL